jgi:hypothetical protein
MAKPKPVMFAPPDMEKFKKPAKLGWEPPKDKKDLLGGVGGMMVTVPAMNTVSPDGDFDPIMPAVKKYLMSNTYRRKVRKDIERRDTRVSRLETWADQVRDHLGDVRVLSNPTGPIKIELPCDGGHVVPWTSANRIPAEAIASKLKRLGWEIGKHIRCPDHAHPRRAKSKKQEGGEVIMTDTLAKDQASDAARTAKRLVILALDETFNTKDGCYRNGQSDATIAKELGIAEDTVARLREEFCGPLKPPSEIEDVRKQLIELQSEHRQRVHTLETEITSKIGKLNSRLDALISRNKWKADV